MLRPGGLFMACSNSSKDSPELSHVWQLEPTTFDASVAPAMVGRYFDEVEANAWDGPFVHPPDEAAVRDYLVGRLMPADEAAAAAQQVDTPLDVTKRGVLVFARRLPT